MEIAKKIFIILLVLFALLGVVFVVTNIHFEGVWKIAFFMVLIAVVVLIRIFTWKSTEKQ